MFLERVFEAPAAPAVSAPRRTIASYLFRTGRAIISWVTKDGGPHKFLYNAKQLLLNVLLLDDSTDSMLRGKTSLVLVRRRLRMLPLADTALSAPGERGFGLLGIPQGSCLAILEEWPDCVIHKVPRERAHL